MTTAKPTTVFPLRGVFLIDTPHIEHSTETKAEADALVATGAFTDDPNHPDRLHSVTEPPVADEPAPPAKEEE